MRTECLFCEWQGAKNQWPRHLPDCPAVVTARSGDQLDDEAAIVTDGGRSFILPDVGTEVVFREALAKTTLDYGGKETPDPAECRRNGLVVYSYPAPRLMQSRRSS